ncbi:DUF2922 domain-containing protein [Pontibacillus litoralis]|uniref:DUF2922 domain-containing protein n=1 Tax=Pontibacillus litoralis JSM 072002 TaxID=1385512 RepID=A0A0A5HTF0_9BACI|nr:DUF2922 domain-containing protein [Pontibacillus litoralis]KGX86902.1 hypothetical protein N784_03345 [Pontibacillus litoralis JSM 072002]
MSKKLELKFYNEENGTVTLSLDDPIEPVDAVAVKQVMDEVLKQDCFFSSGGNLIAKKQARIVERNVTEIEL